MKTQVTNLYVLDGEDLETLRRALGREHTRLGELLAAASGGEATRIRGECGRLDHLYRALTPPTSRRTAGYHLIPILLEEI